MIYTISEAILKNVLSLPPDVIIYDNQSGNTHVLHPPTSDSFLQLRDSLSSMPADASGDIIFHQSEVTTGNAQAPDLNYLFTQLESLEILAISEDV